MLQAYMPCKNTSRSPKRHLGSRHCFTDSYELDCGRQLVQNLLVCHAHTILHVQCAHALDSKFAKVFQQNFEKPHFAKFRLSKFNTMRYVSCMFTRCMPTPSRQDNTCVLLWDWNTFWNHGYTTFMQGEVQPFYASWVSCTFSLHADLKIYSAQ